MTIALFDSHCHINAKEFDADRDALLLRAMSVGISGWLIPSVASDEWESLLAFCHTHTHTYAALGIHPWVIESASRESLDRIQTLIDHNPLSVKAIGETGLDRFKPHWGLQEQFFDAHFGLAEQAQLPLIIHSVKAHQSVLATMKRHPQVTGIVHAFSGSLQEADAFIQRGYKLGVGGVITYSRAQKTRQAIASVPLDCLVLETDAPAMPINGYQGKRNEPERLVDVFDALCELRCESREQVALQLRQSVADILFV